MKSKELIKLEEQLTDTYTQLDFIKRQQEMTQFLRKHFEGDEIQDEMICNKLIELDMDRQHIREILWNLRNQIAECYL